MLHYIIVYYIISDYKVITYIFMYLFIQRPAHDELVHDALAEDVPALPPAGSEIRTHKKKYSNSSSHSNHSSSSSSSSSRSSSNSNSSMSNNDNNNNNNENIILE